VGVAEDERFGASLDANRTANQKRSLSLLQHRQVPKDKNAIQWDLDRLAALPRPTVSNGRIKCLRCGEGGVPKWDDITDGMIIEIDAPPAGLEIACKHEALAFAECNNVVGVATVDALEPRENDGKVVITLTRPGQVFGEVAVPGDADEVWTSVPVVATKKFMHSVNDCRGEAVTPNIIFSISSGPAPARATA
jgi:hypothetical protein